MRSASRPTRPRRLLLSPGRKSAKKNSPPSKNPRPRRYRNPKSGLPVGSRPPSVARTPRPRNSPRPLLPSMRSPPSLTADPACTTSLPDAMPSAKPSSSPKSSGRPAVWGRLQCRRWLRGAWRRSSTVAKSASLHRRPDPVDIVMIVQRLQKSAHFGLLLFAQLRTLLRHVAQFACHHRPPVCRQPL